MRIPVSRLGCWRSVVVAAAIGAMLVGRGARRPFAQLAAAEPGQQVARPAADDELARDLIRRAGVRRGVCAYLGAGRELAREVVRASELLVHCRAPEPAETALAAQAELAEFSIDRMAIGAGPLEKLPYADNLIDLVIASELSAEQLAALPVAEVLRVLRPQGTALVGTRIPAGSPGVEREKMEAWARAGGTEEVESWSCGNQNWVQLRKPAWEGTDDWSHWEHGPDNNPVSTDEVIKAPYLTQFLEHPMYIGMPAVTTAAGGRTFLAIGHIAHHRREWDMMNKLVCRNGYNGTILWDRDLPDRHMVHRSAFIATRDTFYMIDGNRCLLLDPATGEEKGEIRVPGVEGEWKWMAMKDGVLYVLAGEKGPGAVTIKGDRTFGGWSWADLSVGYYRQPRVPWGFGNTLAAYRVDEKSLLWKHEEEKPIDSRAMAVGEKRVFLYGPEQHLRCLDADSGSVVWTNHDPGVLELIEQPGRGLTSTPGFRSCSIAVATPEALVVQGQTRMNVVALSTNDGSLLWTKKKVTNNPNVIYVDGKAVLGVGPGGSHVVVDPVSGDVVEDLQFRKVSCTRLTATPDSFFCRGEGTLRFDRETKRVLIDGGIRPACNDGALPAGGMLYIGPWQCDCNLQLIGACAKCPAGDFRFDRVATEAERLERGTGNVDEVAAFEISEDDWPTYRANNHRTASTKARLARPKPQASPAKTPPAQPARPITLRWQHAPERPCVPSAPTAAGGLVFVSGEDGRVRAFDSLTGEVRWAFATPAPIKMPPTLAEGRAYVGGGDGFVYALEAATGRLLWRFRAAPVERHIMVFGNLCSTWPVNTGVLVHDGVAYFAAGIIDCDGTYVYALDAKTGKIRWQNNACGHLNPELRKGVSAQGNLTIQGDQLLLAGGNQVSPARFELATGKCLAAPFDQGQPKANAGRFVGVFADKVAIAGGRVLYSSPRNVATKGSFVASTDRGAFTLNFGGVPPSWDDDTFALVNFQDGKLACCDAARVAERIEQGFPSSPGARPGHWRALADVFATDGAVRWQSDLNEPNKFEVHSLAVCPESVVAVVQYQNRARAQPQWALAAFKADDGTPIWFWRHDLPGEPLPGGLLVDRHGQVVVTMLDGRVLCFGLAGGPAS
ncbi:MAG TPA: PQQ-binding-like beta-propeller repeat protein [Thermoguttaceae bacterium]|nr:PQQ-binding-like beta-propeller repeat protein [Thermoguttaceae bacterium]